MSRLNELREQRAALIAQARAKLETIDDKTDEVRVGEIETEFDAMMAEADKLERQIDRAMRLEDAESDLDRPVERSAGKEDRRREPERDSPSQSRSLEDLFREAMQFGSEGMSIEDRQRVAALRANVTPEMRAQSTSATAGGYTIPEGFLAEITKSMAMWGPMLDPGITRVIDTATGNPLPWPTVNDTGNVGALLAENTQVAEQDVTFGQKQLDAYLYTSKLVRVSLQLLQDSAFDMNSLLRELFAERIGRIANTHLTTGTGSGQPNGIVTASAAGKTAAAVAAFTADEIVDLVHSVDPAYRSSPNARLMFNDTTLAAIRKLKDGNGNYLWQMGDYRSDVPNTILGYRYTINQAMPTAATGTKPIVFGDFNKYIVRRVRDFTVLRLVERYADYLQVGFVAFNRIDGELADTAAVKHLVMA